MTLFDGIRNSYLVDNLTDENVQKIVAISQEITASDMQDIIKEYDKANDIFIVTSGNVRVTTYNGDPIARLKAGDMVGEIALFDNAERSASVISEDESTLIRIPADQLNALFNAEPAIGLQMLRNVGKTLCTRLKSSNVQLESVLNAL